MCVSLFSLFIESISNVVKSLFVLLSRARVSVCVRAVRDVLHLNPIACSF